MMLCALEATARRTMTVLVVFASFSLAATVARSAPPEVEPQKLGFDAEKLSEIDSIVNEGIEAGEMPGAVVLVGRSGGIAYFKAFGQRQVEPTPEPMTRDTVFDMASITKPVATATSIMSLVQDGKLSPEDKVAKHLPEFGQNGKEEITVAQLLTHTSGLIPDNALKDYEDGEAKAWERIYALKPISEPGSKFQYSDVNFLVLGKLVETLSGKPLNDYAKTEIFEPLGMKETGYLPAEELQQRTATTEKQGDGWIRGTVHDPRAAKLGGVAGHAGLFSTASDLANYATALLANPLVQQNLPLASGWTEPSSGDWEQDFKNIPYEFPLGWETTRLMIEPRDVPRGRRTYGWDSRTGYSSNRGEGMSRRAFGHGGFTGTVFWIDPELDLYYVFLSSRLHPDGKGTVNPLAGKIGTAAVAALQDRAPVSRVTTGIDVLKRDGFKALDGQRVGLITNHTGVSADGTSTAQLLANAKEVDLVALFSPEHGFEGTLDESGIKDTKDATTGRKVYSLYGETRTPTAEMLADLDTLVFDIQDIGARFYTYPSTMANAMEAAAKHGKRFIVLDRPNPINGIDVEGPVLDAGRESFVGFHTIAVRHGMTIGELATMYAAEHELDLDLQVIRMEGWRRADYFDATALRWITPSPNMRSLAQATLYPGIGLLETTNVSVGRGTDTPFEVLGAPWIDGVALATWLNHLQLPGVRFVPIQFKPESSKFEGELCGGINIVVVDRAAFQPVSVGLAIALELRRRYPDDWETKSFDRLLIDKAVYDAVIAERSLNEVHTVFAEELQEFRARRAKYLAYE